MSVSLHDKARQQIQGHHNISDSAPAGDATKVAPECTPTDRHQLAVPLMRPYQVAQHRGMATRSPLNLPVGALSRAAEHEGDGGVGSSVWEVPHAAGSLPPSSKQTYLD